MRETSLLEAWNAKIVCLITHLALRAATADPVTLGQIVFCIMIVFFEENATTLDKEHVDLRAAGNQKVLGHDGATWKPLACD